MFEDRPERYAAWKKFLAGSLLLVIAAATVACLTAFAERKTVTKAFAEHALPGLSDVLPGPIGGPQTILLIGSDERKADRKYGYPARSDTMMLVRLNPDKKVTTVLSIPRDLKVQIPGHGVAKFNESYSDGGPKLVVRTIKQATGLDINHVIVVNFVGFSQAVDRVGCVYTDVDRKYFNNNVGRYVGDQFAVINIKAGYQKLCGTKALQYVRFRHYDSDIYREARQQQFLAQARQQVGITKLFTNANALKNIVSKNTRTDKGLANGANLQRLLKLAVTSASNPVYQVQIPNLTTPTENGVSYVEASSASLAEAARMFMTGPRAQAGGGSSGSGSGSGSSSSTKHKKKKTTSAGLPPGMIYDKAEGKLQAAAAGLGIKLPVYYPTIKMASATYQPDTRGYRITTPDGKRVSAYRIVAKLSDASNGEYYGIQGLNWGSPPITSGQHETRKIGGRTYMLFYEGSKLSLVAFKVNGATYYVANTLTRKLTDKQMLAIARSLKLKR